MADYCTYTEVKAQMEKTTSGGDTVLAAMVTAASRCIDNFCNRPDGFVALGTATARLYAGSGRGYQFIDECVAVTLVEVKDSPTDSSFAAWDTGDWIAASGGPREPDFNRLPYDMLIVDPTGDESVFTGGVMGRLRGFAPDPDASASRRGVPTVRITAKWGYAAAVPEPVKQACITQVARWFKRGESAWSDTVGAPDFGQLMYRQKLDPDVALVLVEGRLVRPVVG